MTYLITFSLCLSLAWVYDHVSQKNQKNFLEVVIVLILTLVGGLRSLEIGTDNYNYKAMFDYSRYHSLLDCLYGGAYISTKEKGFVVLTWLISRINENYVTFTLVTSFITIFLVFEGMKYFSDRYEVRMMLEVYLFTYYCSLFNLVRQGLTLAMVFYAIRYADQKKIVKFVLLIILAASIHLSAIIFLPFYLIYRRDDEEFFAPHKYKNDKKIIPLVLAISFFVYIGPTFVGKVFYLVSKIPIIPISSRKLIAYGDLFLAQSKYLLVKRLILRAVPQVIIATLFYPSLKSRDKRMESFYMALIIQLGLMFLGGAEDTVARMALYYNYPQMIVFSAIVSNKRSANRFFVEIGILLYLILYWVIFTVFNYYGYNRPVYPYQLVF